LKGCLGFFALERYKIEKEDKNKKRKKYFCVIRKLNFVANMIIKLI